MRDLYKAKEKYNSIEIPKELNGVVFSTIQKSKVKKKSPFGYVIRFAPIAACFLVITTIAVGYFNRQETLSVPGDEEIPAAASLPRMMSYSPAVANRVANELEAIGEVTELFSGRDYASVSVRSYSTGEVIYYNMRQSDGSDVFVNDLVPSLEQGTRFYIKTDETVVVFDGDKQKEYKISER